MRMLEASLLAFTLIFCRQTENESKELKKSFCLHKFMSLEKICKQIPQIIRRPPKLRTKRQNQFQKTVKSQEKLRTKNLKNQTRFEFVAGILELKIT